MNQAISLNEARERIGLARLSAQRRIILNSHPRDRLIARLRLYRHKSGLQEIILTTGRVAMLFRVSPKTVQRWVGEGKLDCFYTLGGHRRYHGSQVLGLLEYVGLA